MEERMKENVRKLALWHSRTFKPIMTHDELEPIMATLGFVGLRPTQSSGCAAAWKEYVYAALGRGRREDGTAPPPPKPKLPYPRIDGLHNYTYSAFIDAVKFYLQMRDISLLFHIRGMPLDKVHDKSKKWRCLEGNEYIYVYREGTLDQATHNMYHFDLVNNRYGNGNEIVIRSKGNCSSSINCCFVPLKDIVSDNGRKK